MPRNDANRRSAARRGSQAGIVLFGLLMSAFTGICTVQILAQVFFGQPAEAAEGDAEANCLQSATTLRDAVVRARRAVLHTGLGEFEALAAFRKALEPNWQSRVALDQRCKAPGETAALALVDEFRYAEEHFVRLEATRLETTNQALDHYLNAEPQ